MTFLLNWTPVPAVGQQAIFSRSRPRGLLQVQGACQEVPYGIRQFPPIRAPLASQRADQRLTDSSYHQRNREMWINVFGNNAVTLGHFEHPRTLGELPTGKGGLDIQHLGRTRSEERRVGKECRL